MRASRSISVLAIVVGLTIGVTVNSVAAPVTSGVVDFKRAPKAEGAGWTPLVVRGAAVGEIRPTYTVRLVNSPNVEKFRGTVQQVIDELNSHWIAKFVLADGTVDGTTPSSGEIRVVAGLDICGKVSRATKACGGPFGLISRPDGRWLVDSGQVAIRTSKFSNPTSAVAHEFGHVLGLGHCSGTKGGAKQIMNPASSKLRWGGYRLGDMAGLVSMSENRLGTSYWASRGVWL